MKALCILNASPKYIKYIKLVSHLIVCDLQYINAGLFLVWKNTLKQNG